MNVLLATLLLSVAAGTPWHQLDRSYTFDRYCAEFGKTYATLEERSARKATFEARLTDVLSHNADASRSYKRGVNHLSDRTLAELRAFKGVNKALLFKQRAAAAPSSSFSHKKAKSLPKSVDYRDTRPSIVTPVKNQGGCGSCWAFASTETLESHWAIKTGHLQDLAPQFILDCVPNPDKCGGTGGCEGGTAALAYTRLAALGGQPSEWTYPYVSGTGHDGFPCRNDPFPPEHPHSGAVMRAANVTGHVAVPSNDYNAVMDAIAHVGPLTITVDAGGWHDYETGVFDGGNHTNPTLDHLVQLVGYGTDSSTGKDYFLVRNSWTPEWGEDGYIRLFRSPTPSCGIDLNPMDGDGCAGGPPTVKVCGQSGVLYDAAYPYV